MELTCVITFDIDGTLLRSKGPKGNAAHKDAIRQAIKEIWNVNGSVGQVQHAGKTDQIIIRDVLLHNGINENEIWPNMNAAIYKTSQIFKTVYAPNLNLRNDVLPGVELLLQKLNQVAHLNKGDPKVFVGLVTGNIESIAWEKMKAAGLAEYFSFGGFGSDALDRSDIMRCALKKLPFDSRQLIQTANIWHIGDADTDVLAAKQVGVKSLGVLTGQFSRSCLNGADVILENLTEVDHILNTIFEVKWYI